MHRCPLVLGSDVEIPEAISSLVEEVSEAVRVDLQYAYHQVRLFRKDISILPDPRNRPGFFQLVQKPPKIRPFFDLDIQSFGEVDLVEWLILW